MRLEKYLKSLNSPNISQNISINRIDDLIKVIKDNCQPFLKDWLKQKNDINVLWRGTWNYDNFYEIKDVRQDRVPKDTPSEIHNFLDEWFFDNFGIYARSKCVFTSPKIKHVKSYGNPYIIFPIGNYDIVWSTKIKDLYNDLVDSGLFKEFYEGNNYDEEYNKEYGEENNNDFGTWQWNEYEVNTSSKDKAFEEIFERVTDDLDINDTDEKWDQVRSTIDTEMKFTPEQGYDEFVDGLKEKFNQENEELLNRSGYKKGKLLDALKTDNEIMLSCHKYIQINEDFLPYIIKYFFDNKSKKQLTFADYIKNKG